LQMANLFSKRGLPRSRRWSFAALQRLELLAPGIQQAPTDPEFLREGHDVVALVQPVDGHLPKGLRKFAPAFLGHLPPPSCVKCAYSSCLNLGGQSISCTINGSSANREGLWNLSQNQKSIFRTSVDV